MATTDISSPSAPNKDPVYAAYQQGGGKDDYTTFNTNQTKELNSPGPAYGTKEYYDAIAAKNPSTVGIVTSNKSQSNYNNNVSTLNNSLNGLNNSAGYDTNGNPIADPNTNTPSYLAPDGKTYASRDDYNKTINQNQPANGSTINDANGNVYNIPQGMDPGIAQSLVGNLNSATGDIQTYQSQINNLNNYDVTTDPVAVSAANSIKESFNILIQQMENKNKMLMGSINTNSARSGMMQFGNEIDSMYKNAEFDAATQRIADLKQKETDAINRSNQAYQSGNVKALDAAVKDLEKAKTDGRNALLDLQKTINDTIKSNQNQAKIDAADIKTQNNLDIANSKAVAQATLDQIMTSGITDQTKIDAFINDVATQNGISNPDILKGQISILNPQSGTAALKNKNLIATINKKNQPKVTKPVVDKQVAALQSDIKKEVASLNTKTASGNKTGWKQSYNTIAQNYGGIKYPINGTYVKITDKLTQDQINSIGGNPDIDETVIDVLMDKKDNYEKIFNQ